VSAYVVAHVTITNPEGFAPYSRQVAGTLEKYGGKFLVRGGPFEAIEGEAPFQRLVILEFPSMEQARTWYASEEYRAILPARLDNSRTDLIMAEGVPAA